MRHIGLQRPTTRGRALEAERRIAELEARLAKLEGSAGGGGLVEKGDLHCHVQIAQYQDKTSGHEIN
jgi:hypothetical protein